MKKSPRPPTTKTQHPRPMTKRQLSKHQRDVKLQRLTKLGFVAVIAIAVLVVAAGYWREIVAPGGESILTVRGTSINTQTYAKVLGFRQYALDRQAASLQAYAQSANANDENSALMQQFVQQQIQQLSQQRASLETDVLDQLIDDQFIIQEAAKRGISASAADIDTEIYEPYAPPAPATNTDDASASATPSAATGTPVPAPTPMPTPTPMTQEQVLAETRKQVDESGLMSEGEYRDLIVRPQVLRDKLQAAMAAQVSPIADQVWARHILVDDQNQANDALAKLQSGGDFAALALELSTDTSNKEKGGDLSWFTRGTMVAEFDNAAFALQAGQLVTEPVKTTYGYHIIQALGRQQDRPLSEDQLKAAKDSALENWLRTVRIDEAKAITYGYSWERLKWARDWISNNAKYLKASEAANR